MANRLRPVRVGGAAGRDRSRSSPTVASSSTPVSTPASSAGRSASRSPFCSTAMTSSPSTVPGTLPRPPKIDVPPSTTAVIAVSS